MTVDQYPLGELQANCYVLSLGNQCLLIDPGDSADFILEKIIRCRCDLVGILSTHGHFDHVMAVGEIQLSYPVPFYTHNKDQFLIERLESSARHFLGYDMHVIPPVLTKNLEPGLLSVGDFTFEVLETPGHTPGGCCFFFKEEQALFTGDTVFKDGVGSFDHGYSSRSDLKKSIQRILELEEYITVFSGHGDPTSIGMLPSFESLL